MLKKIFYSYFTITIFLFLAGSCSLPYQREARMALNILDNAIAKLESESVNWRQVLDDTRENLVKESTEWRGEASYIVDTGIPKIINEGIASAGEEFRCDFDFVRIRARQELISLRNRLAEEIKVPTIPNPRKPVICKFNPTHIDISLVPERLKVVEVAGYNFDQGNISIWTRGFNRVESEFTSSLAISTHYHMTIRLSRRDTRLVASNSVILSNGSDKLFVRVNGDEYALNVVGQVEERETTVHRAPPVP
jgi:hypothetical protein